MNHSFKIVLVIIFLCPFAGAVFGQKNKGKNEVEIRVPMDAAHWEHDTSHAEFVTHRNVKAVKPRKGGYQITLKDQVFKDGIIEYDVELTGIGFPGINFRTSADGKYWENFYIRSFGKVAPESRYTLQYATVIDNVSMWDLSDEYQAGAVIYQEGWNHIKLVVSGRQMKAYVNDMTKPALAISRLEGRDEAGKISLTGNVIYANLTIKPNVTEGLSAAAGYSPADFDPNYIRDWMVSPAQDFPLGRDLVFPLPSMRGMLNKSELPDNTTAWSPLAAEYRGVVNLSTKFGGVPDDGRRLAWIKTTINSASAQEKLLRLGFSDEIWLFVNGRLLHVDKNYFGTLQQKDQGRCTLNNATIRVPLKTGDNELLIALANYFYGWGIVARFEDMEGIRVGR